MRDRFLSLLLLGALACAADAWPTKLVGRTFCPLALAPVELRLERTGDASAGQTFRLTLTATARADCPDATLEIVVPGNATLVSGQSRWTGALANGESRSLAVDVSVGDNVRRRFQGAVEVRRETSVLPGVVVHETGSAPAAASIQSIPEEMTPEGVRIMVLPAREVSP